MLFECHWTKVVWFGSALGLHLDDMSGPTISRVQDLLDIVRSTIERMNFHTSLANIAWQIWKYRNECVFNDIRPCPSRTLSLFSCIDINLTSVDPSSLLTSCVSVVSESQESSIHAFRLLVTYGWQNVVIESDSKVAISLACAKVVHLELVMQLVADNQNNGRVVACLAGTATIDMSERRCICDGSLIGGSATYRLQLDPGPDRARVRGRIPREFGLYPWPVLKGFSQNPSDNVAQARELAFHQFPCTFLSSDLGEVAHTWLHPNMGLLDYIRTADPRKVQMVEVQKGEEQVTLFDSIKHCFVSLDAPAAAHQASGSGSGAGAEVSVSLLSRGRVMLKRMSIPESAFVESQQTRNLNLTVARKDVAQRQPEEGEEKEDSVASTACFKTSVGIWSGSSQPETVWRSPTDTLCPLGREVRSRAEHELELKEKLRGKYDARGVLLKEKDAEIARLKSLLEEKEMESAEVLRLRD
ncbi:hypothetical protein Tco_0465113 [Tanacetum coccineum]